MALIQMSDVEEATAAVIVSIDQLLASVLTAVGSVLTPSYSAGVNDLLLLLQVTHNHKISETNHLRVTSL